MDLLLKKLLGLQQKKISFTNIYQIVILVKTSKVRVEDVGYKCYLINLQFGETFTVA